MKTITLQELLHDHIIPACHEYDDYVALARKTEEDRIYPLVDKLFRENPDMIAKLESEAGDWHHGFNSGILAYTRLLIGIIEAKHPSHIADAYGDFPELYT